MRLAPFYILNSTYYFTMMLCENAAAAVVREAFCYAYGQNI
jgi:hypothetical protein